jgi:hypothetical protein
MDEVIGTGYEQESISDQANKFKTDIIHIPAFEPNNPILKNYLHEWENAKVI